MRGCKGEKIKSMLTSGIVLGIVCLCGDCSGDLDLISLPLTSSKTHHLT